MDSLTYTANPLLHRRNFIVPPKRTRQRISTVAAGTRGFPMAIRCSVTGEDVFSVTSSSKYEVDYLGETTKGDLNLNFGIDGGETMEGPIEEVAKMEAKEAEDLLKHLGIPVNTEI